MPRPPLPIGTYGKITTYEVGYRTFRAYTKFRDADGVTRRVSRNGKTKAAAERSLKAALSERTTSDQATVQASSRFAEVAEPWFESVRTAVDRGELSPSTLDVYRSQLDRHVLPAIGQLRLREVTVPRVDDLLSAVRNRRGASTAKTVRTVVSGVLGLAVRYGALGSNPTRETARIGGQAARAPRALSLQERQDWLKQLEASDKASRWELPDLTRFMLATGVRIGEALAITWADVDLEAAAVEVNYTVLRVKDRGLVRKSTKTSSGERTLRLPTWAVAMLRRRKDGNEDDTTPVFPDSFGGLRDPSNVLKVFRETRGESFAWVTSHVFRKTAATILDEAGLSARQIADQLGHSKPSLTQDVYMGRKAVGGDAAQALEDAADM